MGQGFYFNMPTAAKARKAARLFEIKAVRNFKSRVHPLGMTRTQGGRYISGVDVCGPYNPRLHELYHTIVREVEYE